MEQLKPCPFCGAKVNDIYYGSELGDTYSEGESVYSINCPECGAYMSKDYQDELIVAWNKRA